LCSVIEIAPKKGKPRGQRNGRRLSWFEQILNEVFGGANLASLRYKTFRVEQLSRCNQGIGPQPVDKRDSGREFQFRYCLRR